MKLHPPKSTFEGIRLDINKNNEMTQTCQRHNRIFYTLVELIEESNISIQHFSGKNDNYKNITSYIN